MKFKFIGILVVLVCLVPSVSSARTINGDLNVGGNLTGGLLKQGAYGLTLALSAGTLTIECNGAACSSTNFGHVVVPSTTAGQLQVYKITSSPTFQDGAHATDSDFVGVGGTPFGVTSGVAWGNDRPLAIKFCHDGTTGIFGLSPNPTNDNSPVTAQIGYKDVPPSSDADTNIMFMTTSNVTTSHDDVPCLTIGSLRATMDSSDDWTFTSFDEGDGIENYYNFGSRIFYLPTGQMGASSGKHMADNGGTAPTFTTSVIGFTLDRLGYVAVNVRLDGNTATDGSGAVQARVSMPYVRSDGTSGNISSGTCYFMWGATPSTQWGVLQIDNGNSYTKITKNNSATSTGDFSNSDFPNQTRRILGNIVYKVFS